MRGGSCHCSDSERPSASPTRKETRLSFDAEAKGSVGMTPDAAAVMGKIGHAAARMLLAGLRFYQVTLSPLMPVGCKFHPSCSHYAAEAIERHGALHGTRLAVWRLLRCSPFTRGGFDPVPDLVASFACDPHREAASILRIASEVTENKVSA